MHEIIQNNLREQGYKIIKFKLNIKQKSFPIEMPVRDIPRPIIKNNITFFPIEYKEAAVEGIKLVPRMIKRATWDNVKDIMKTTKLDKLFENKK